MGNTTTLTAKPTPTASCELIPEAEYPIVLAVPAKKTMRLRGQIRSSQRGRQDLALSDAEWSNLSSEGADG